MPRRPAGILLTFATLLLVTHCDTESSPPLQTVSDCPGGVCRDLEVVGTEPRSGVQWADDDPEFVGFFQIVDEANRPIPDAEVRVGGRLVTSDEHGEAPIDQLAATEQLVGRASHPMYLESAFKASYDTAGIQKQTITMLRAPERETVDAGQAVTLRQGDAQWRFAQQPFARADGTRIDGLVNVRMRAIAASSLPPSALPGDLVVESEDGSTAMIRQHFSLIMTEVQDMEGKEVRFAPGTSAQLSLRLPGAKNLGLSAGKKLGMYSLDMARAKWAWESFCEVQEAREDEDSLTCVGAVNHFSYWLVAQEWDVYNPETFGCVNMLVDTSEITSLLEPRDGAAHAPYVGYLPLRRCNDTGTCSWDPTFYYGQRAWLKPTDDQPYPSICGVTEAGEGYRFDARIIRPGESSFLVTHPVTVESLQGATGGDLLLNQMLDPKRDCPTLCQQVVVKPTTDDLLAGLNDTDNDGYFASDDDGAQERLINADCDDTDPATRPGAHESLCESVDRNCDGRAPSDDVSYRVPKEPGPCTNGFEEVGLAPAMDDGDDDDDGDSLPLCYFTWNRYCDGSCFELESERTGNAYDEDCDGVALDPDGDGFYVKGYYESRHREAVERLELTDGLRPGDCHDGDPNVNPDAEEIVGNYVDEDCDGIALDADGDGFFAYGHELAAQNAGLMDGDLDLSLMFGDCNDYDPASHPAVTPEEEAGQLRDLYHEVDGRPTMRKAWFCDYFDADGNPSRLFRRRVHDLNCDGQLTDIDGDGLTSPGDVSLGAAKAVDCDDYDPRLSAELNDDGELTCKGLDRSGLVNESECEPLTDEEGVASAVSECPLLAGRIRTDCTMVVEDVNLCLFPGWDTANPLRLTPGLLWGPCDGQGRVLPDCPAGATCGAPAHYSDELIEYLKEAYTDGADLEYQGMCFRNCVP